MTDKFYSIYSSRAGSFAAALDDVLAQIDSEHPIIRIVVFGAPADNQTYIRERELIEQRCREHFQLPPMVAYIAQAPLCSELVAEVTHIDKGCKVEHFGDYILLDDCEIISGAIYDNPQNGITHQSEVIFDRVREILSRHSFRTDDIVRQWNYIERITYMGEEGQHYQLFNDARSRFYDTSKWENGYPAATGIGTQQGGITILFDALRNSQALSRAIDNPLQISAHAYSQQVLINNTDTNKTTPKFERARHVAAAIPMIYISGTAAIRGEESCYADAVMQTRLTMENIDHLVSVENQAASGVCSPMAMKYTTLRAYLKRKEDLTPINTWMNKHYPDVQTIYLWADICREELLIEIEGIATKK